VIWIGGRRMKRCRGCGDTFAFRHHGEWYCMTCRAARASRWPSASKPKLPEVRASRLDGQWARVWAAELDAKAALAELRAWMSEERAR
jgi:hypothetical protein